MNLVQLADQAKNLSNQQLQQMLQAPDGAMPPFLLAAEAARRQDIERSVQTPPATSTVLDDLIQSRAQSAGGLNALNPQAPQPEGPPQPQMARGGIISLATGSLVPPPNRFRKDITNPAFPVPGNTWGGMSFDPQKIGPTLDSIFGYDGEVDTENPIPSTFTPGEDAAEKRRLQQNVDQQAAAKEAETAAKKGEMGDTGADDAPPEGGAETDEYRERLAEIYGGDDDVRRLLGLSSSGLARMGAALLSRERGLSEGQRWANAAAAMADDTESRDTNKQKTAQEEEMALLKYDMAKAAADEAKINSSANEIASAHQGQAEFAMKQATEIRQRMSDLMKPYSSVDPFSGAITGTAEPPPEIKTEVARLQEMYNRAILAAQASNQQGAGIYGIEPFGVRMPDGSLSYK